MWDRDEGVNESSYEFDYMLQMWQGVAVGFSHRDGQEDLAGSDLSNVQGMQSYSIC